MLSVSAFLSLSVFISLVLVYFLLLRFVVNRSPGRQALVLTSFFYNYPNPPFRLHPLLFVYMYFSLLLPCHDFSGHFLHVQSL